MAGSVRERALALSVASGIPDRLRALRERFLALPSVARSVQTVLVVASSLRVDPITLRAAALTYLSVLSLVPLLTVVFSVFQAIVGRKELESRLRDFMLQNLAVGAQESTSHYITQYIQRASSIGGIGFIFLLVSAVSLMANIEAAFNHIFQAPRARPILRRFLIYWCVLTIGPILLALSLAATAVVQSSTESLLPSLIRRVFVLVPLLVTYSAFTLMYSVVPNVTVHRRPALVGALIAGTAWEIAKVVYGAIVARTVSNTTIYGSLSIVPVFLVWTYLSWIIVLFGARVTYAAQIAQPGAMPESVETPIDHELLVARVMRAIAIAFARGAAPPDTDRLTVALPALGPDVNEALDRLTLAGLIRPLAEGGWAPARSLKNITLAHVRTAARGAETNAKGAPDLVDLEERWARADKAAGAELAMSLEDLVGDSTLPR